VTLDEAHVALSIAFRAPTIEGQADGFEVAADAFEEASAPVAAGSVRVWAAACRRAGRILAGKYPRAIKIGSGFGIAHDAPPGGVRVGIHPDDPAPPATLPIGEGSR
jgi:hypothetical protein